MANTDKQRKQREIESLRKADEERLERRKREERDRQLRKRSEEQVRLTRIAVRAQQKKREQEGNEVLEKRQQISEQAGEKPKSSQEP